jgi:hypothetical protein
MNNYLAIVADIKTKLTGIPGVGMVHDYERWTADWAKFLAFFTDSTGKILGWEITRAAASEHQAGAFFRHHQFKLNGYMGLNDAKATSKAFQALCDEVCAAFRSVDTSTPWGYSNGDSPANSAAQIESINDRMFGNVLCHCAEISLSVTERILA